MKYKEIPILMYHEISEVNNPWCVSPQQFQQQMQFLKDNSYKTITLNQLDAGLEQKEATEEKLVILTFDDARKGVYTYAYPLLKKNGFTAAIYVVPSWIESKEIIKKESYSEFLTWAELNELSENNFTIGAHTNSHPNLTTLNQEKLIQELDLANQEIFQKLNLRVEHFAYPYGLYNDNTLKETSKRYKTSMTIKKGFDKTKSELSRQAIMHDTSLEQFSKLLNLPTISLCMITKNEEMFLEQCLDSVKELVDEIIIVDTGSTDKTKVIANKFTDKIYDFAWCDDFSAARNESLKQATKDWILILDADEKLNPEDCRIIKEATNNWSTTGFRILTKNYSNDSTINGWQPWHQEEISKSSQGWFPSLKVRLFQRDQRNYFQGKIHELVDPVIENNGGQIAVLNASVQHYGTLNKEDTTKKTEKYLHLTKKKIKDNPQDAKAYFELGVQYKNLNKYELAENNFKHSLEIEPNQIQPLLNLAIVQQKQNKLDEAINNYLRILVIKKNFSEAYFGLGFCYFKRNLLEKAKENFTLATLHKPTYLDAHINLGAIYEKLNEFEKAVLCYKKALEINSKNPRVYYNLGVIHERTTNLPMALKCYQQALKLNYSNKSYLEKRIIEIKTIINKQE